MKKVFIVQGMSCQHCVHAIKKQLENAGFKDFSVQIGSVEIEMSDDKIETEKIKSLIKEAGYTVVNE